MTQVDIAYLITPDGIDPKTLREHFRKELDRGAPKANASVSQRLYQRCMAGDITAIIWWDKMRDGRVPAVAIQAVVEERHSVSTESVGGPPGTVKGQTQSVPRFEGDQEEGNRKLIVLQRAHGAIR